MEIKGMVAVVSGGASGLGEGTCRYLVEKGAKVCILDMDEKRGLQLAEELGDSALFYKTNVADTDNVRAAIDQIMETFGGINAAISCAGVAFGGKILSKKGTIDMELFDKVVKINLHGTMNVLSCAAEMMSNNEPNEDGERGVIINTASGAAFQGQIGQAAYSASKAGVVGMTLPIAKELAHHGIRIMAISPGLFETPMLDGLPQPVKDGIIKKVPFPKRMGKASEFAMLCGQIIENPMLNGRNIRFDAAVTMV
jgi:3-hydroxyacyl-CoA dehydrogenase/3-hydroxy-2-methylbutyryl-CoA dehydrogenase